MEPPNQSHPAFAVGIVTDLGVLAALIWFRLLRRHAAGAALIAAILCGWILAPFRGLAADNAERPKGFDLEVARKYAGVKEWQGFWEVTETRSFSKSNAMGYTENVYEGSGHGRFTLQRSLDTGWDPAGGDFRWLGSGEASGMRSETMASWSKSGPRMVGTDWREHDDGRAPMKEIEFTIWMGRQHASLHVGSGTQGAVTKTRKGRSVSEESSADGQHHYSEKDINETFPGAILTFFVNNYEATKAKHYQVVQAGPGVLVFTEEERSHDAASGDSLRRSQVVMVPVYDNLECEVTIEGYGQWRPKGSIADPKKPGNGLVARAVLKSKDGKDKDLPEVDRFRFELIETSREPGICMNWPLGAKDDDFDLKLADFKTGSGPDRLAAMRRFLADWGIRSMGDYDLASMPDGGLPKWGFPEVTEDGQKGELPDPPKDKDGHPFAEAAIECFDFGAKSELRVTCILKDGRELLGLMKGEGGEGDLVRLPKRNGPDWVAESWRKEHDVMNLAAGDDNEKIEGQKENGDGFTLYEEYRGWVENGKHIEGDPKGKDFFVLNLFKAKADAQNGINLFEALSKLRVHSKLRPSEMSETVRLMNGNHRDAPHRVDQHGVWVKQFASKSELGDNGADTPLTKKGVAGRPGITIGVGILARNDTNSIFNQPFNLPARDTIFAYDRAIAHELLHSVGVEHHGAKPDIKISLVFITPSDPRNHLGRAHFATLGGTVFNVLNEEGQDVAAKYQDEFSWVIQQAHIDLLPGYLSQARKDYAIGQSYGKNSTYKYSSPEAQAEAEFYNDQSAVYSIHGLIGVRQGAHSGDQDCVMRYYFAEFYEATGRKDTIYQVNPGTERIGIDICHSGKGTGINASSHEPQSRYGNAAAGEGDCFSQICPNDAIPPRAVEK